MPFCINCGHSIPDGANFCANCGSTINETTEKHNNQKKIIYDSEVHKCPYCNTTINAFDSFCPACEHELRGRKATSSVNDLAEKLEHANSEEQRIIIIKNFPIPNTKEDIFEFMFLATSNFDTEYYISHLSEEDISDAWLSKIEQCYKKAKLLLSKEDFEIIEKTYIDIKSNITKSNIKSKNQSVLSIFFIIIGLLLILTQFIPIAAIGLVLLIIGIAKLVANKNKIHTNNHRSSSIIEKQGFPSWSTTAKILWIILNIYTIGIPAIIYTCCNKNRN